MIKKHVFVVFFRFTYCILNIFYYYMSYNNEKKTMNFITGEKIQLSCDHFIGIERDFRYNPNIYKARNKFLDINKINDYFENKKKIFCYNSPFISLELLTNKLKFMKNPFTLVFHNSDESLNEKHLILFENLSLLECIYAQNVIINHEKVIPIPIGLANSQWIHGNPQIHKEVYEMTIIKTKNIYFNFNIGNNPNKRQICYDIINKKDISWNKNLPYKNYLIELKKHKFAICPEGNGIDTHRFWECLYMNTIPICLKNTITTYYKKYFPIVLLDDWRELDITKLKYTTFDHKHLNIENLGI